MKASPQRHPIVVEADGHLFKGTYWVAGKIITVTNSVGGKSTQVGKNLPEDLARKLLGELVREGKVYPKPDASLRQDTVGCV